jgi:hypothetical protein
MADHQTKLSPLLRFSNRVRDYARYRPRGPIVTSVQQRGSATDLATAHGQEAKRRGPSASPTTAIVPQSGHAAVPASGACVVG